MRNNFGPAAVRKNILVRKKNYTEDGASAACFPAHSGASHCRHYPNTFLCSKQLFLKTKQLASFVSWNTTIIMRKSARAPARKRSNPTNNRVKSPRCTNPRPLAWRSKAAPSATRINFILDFISFRNRILCLEEQFTELQRGGYPLMFCVVSLAWLAHRSRKYIMIRVWDAFIGSRGHTRDQGNMQEFQGVCRSVQRRPRGIWSCISDARDQIIVSTNKNVRVLSKRSNLTWLIGYNYVRCILRQLSNNVPNNCSLFWQPRRSETVSSPRSRGAPTPTRCAG